MNFLTIGRDTYAEWGVFVRFSLDEQYIEWFGSNRQAAFRYKTKQTKEGYCATVIREVIRFDKIESKGSKA